MIDKIIVAVDARPLSDPLSGIGRYCFELLNIMVKDGNVVWRLYSHKPLLHLPESCHNVEVIHCNFGNRIFRMFWAQFLLPFFIFINKPTHFWSPAHRIPIFLPSKIKKIVTIHDFVWHFCGNTMRPFSRLLDSYLMPQAIKMADEVIAVSQNTSEDLSKLFPKYSSKVSIIPLGFKKVSKEKLVIRQFIHDAIDSGPYFLFVGTLEPRKNLIRLIHAFSIAIPYLNSSVRLLIAGGNGWGRVDVNSAVKNFSIENKVKLLGFVTDDELSLLYSNALFLALPSLYEGFGLPLVESMSYGVPVLSSKISSMPEIVSDAGVLIDPYSTDSIANGIALLVNSDDLRKELAEKSLRRINEYSWELSAKKTFDVITR